ncbi:MAG: hypothetical protein APF82_09020 [Sphingomonadales bacterium BRH_c42]|nr:MAG: hypothetical protein APF82_09020 [Sphingomonadales bacterium BRH_c42]
MDHSNHSIRRRLAVTGSTAALALALLAAQPVYAQSDAAVLQGRVDGAQAGAVVVVTDIHTGQQRTGKVDEQGNYVIIGLRPSTYRVEVEGRDPMETTLLIGQTSVVDFTDASREIVVRGGRIVQEVRTQSVVTNVTPAQIEHLPQNKRNFLAFAELAPGLSVSRGGNAQIQAGSVASSNVNVFLDGVSIKNPINHGGVLGQNFGLGNPFPQIAIQEYKVETQNFGAETGQAGSAVLTAITKTGGDEFHGSAFIQFQPKGFITQPFFDKQRGFEKPDYNRKQFGGELGGPIIPGKLNFYVAMEGTDQNLPGATGNVTTPIPQNLASEVNVTHNNDFKQQLYFGKLTFYASGEDTINLSGFIRSENNLSDIDGNATPSHGRTIRTNEDRYQLNWTHAGDDIYNVLNISYLKATQSTPSVGTGPELILAQGTSFDAIVRAGAHFFEQGDRTRALTFRDDLTLARGDHRIKLGAQVAFLDLTRNVSDHFNGSFFFTNPGAVASFDFETATPFGAQINLQPSDELSSSDTQIGLYAQDEWAPDEHWTVNLGLRWDFESNANNNNYVTPQAVADALRNYPGWAANGIDPEDFISTGDNRGREWGAFQPRLGISYDVHGDRDLVFFAGAGRYYDRNLFIEGVIETLTNENKTVTVPFCSATVTTGCLDYSSALRDTDALRAAAAPLFPGGGSVFVLNNKTSLPYSDQFNIGVRKRFGDIQASLTLSHIESDNIFQFVRSNFFENGWFSRFVTRDANGNVTGCTDGGRNWIQDFSPGGLSNGDGSPVPVSVCAAQNAQLAGFSGKLDRGVSDGKARFTGLYFELEKPFTDVSEWGFRSVLTIQRATSNVAMELNGDEFFNGADQTGFGWQKVNGIEDWRYVLTGNWRAPWDIDLSGFLTLTSGPRFGTLQAPWNGGPAAPDGACCVGNLGGPLSPKRFIGYKRFDLRVAKTFKMPYGEGHELTVDFQAFNVFNWLNRNYSSWGAGGGVPPPLVEDSQVGNDARSFQAGIKYRF